MLTQGSIPLARGVDCVGDCLESLPLIQMTFNGPISSTKSLKITIIFVFAV